MPEASVVSEEGLWGVLSVPRFCDVHLGGSNPNAICWSKGHHAGQGCLLSRPHRAFLRESGDTLQVQPSEEADVLSAGAFLLIQPVFNEGCTPDSAATSPLLLSLYLSSTQLQLIWLLPMQMHFSPLVIIN